MLRVIFVLAMAPALLARDGRVLFARCYGDAAKKLDPVYCNRVNGNR